MTREEILRGVGEVAREHLGFDGRLAPEMDLVEDLSLDSIRLLTLAVEVENRFRICLDEQDEAGITTVGDLVTAVAGKLAAPGTAPGTGSAGSAGSTGTPGEETSDSDA